MLNELKERYKDLVGELNYSYTSNMILLSGNLYSETDEKEIREYIKDNLSNKYSTTLFVDSLKINKLSINCNEGSTNNQPKDNILDDVEILYYGEMETRLIKFDEKFRNPNITIPFNMTKIDNCIKVLNFISPIILDSKLNVIDGNKRLQLAIDNDIRKVLVVVIDDCGVKADFLRLALNRSSEFQRWNYKNVDAYVDSVPQAQPLLEPLGFFGLKILPTSFFSNTVLDYKIDPFNEKQKQYNQDIGLAEWAEYRREQMAKESEQRRKKYKRVIDENTISLFDLRPKDEDFLETYDPEEEMDKIVQKWKSKAEAITEQVDEETRERLAITGGEWQASARTSKEVAADKRDRAIQSIKDNEELSDEEKTEVIEHIDAFADIIQDVNAIRDRLYD